SLLRDMRARKVPYPTVRRDADLLYLRGGYDSLEKLIRVAARGENATFATGAAGALRDLVAVRGRFRESDSIAAALVARTQGANAVERAVSQAMTDGWFRGRTPQAIARLDSVARANPARDATLDLRLQLVSLYAILGAPDRARATFRESESVVVDSVTRRITQSRFLGAQADIAMAEGRTDAAVAAYRRAETAGDGLPQGCVFCTPVFIGIAYDRANMADSAIANLERYISVPASGRAGLDRWLLAPTHKRLGELYEAKGDNARAVSHYTEFVRLWERADPDMQPKVAEVRARLERLLKTLPR
ncbi:MAG: protein kinase, partial [Geminicoccaceae bacterium]|nr:protein kinase [Geminicoccaceae bacterium]